MTTRELGTPRGEAYDIAQWTGEEVGAGPISGKGSEAGRTAHAVASENLPMRPGVRGPPFFTPPACRT